MLDFDELRQRINNADSQMKKNIGHLGTMAKDAERVSGIAKNAHSEISNIDRQFEEATKLTGLDITLLFLAVALHLVRQYFQPKISFRTDDKTAAKTYKEKDKFGSLSKDELQNMKHGWYNPSFEEVVGNPVPFDIAFGGGIDGFDIFTLPKEIADFYKSISPKGMRHRTATLGHDPVLGWVFGTANIATATITTWKLASYHVKYSPNTAGAMCPKIVNHANIELIFENVKKKIMSDNFEDKKIIAASLIREGIHLKSDQYSNSSLAIPFAALRNPKFAEHLASFGFDMANIGNLITVGKQASLASLVNMIIAMIHGLINTKNIDNPNYDFLGVRTRKILWWSNLLSTTSNVLYVAINAVPKIAGAARFGPEAMIAVSANDLKNLDIGGLLVTVHRLISDTKFISKIKQEFLEKEFYKEVMGDDFNFQEE
jgi:hypothetical protein